MTETKAEGYLDELVMKYLHLNNPLGILEAAPEKERPAVFLDRIGWVQQKDYIEDALNAYLTTSSPPLPQGQIYVFTPIDSFKYYSARGRVTHAGVRNGSSDDTTFNEALNEILKQVDADTSEGRETLAHILFFDAKSLKKFEDILRRRLHDKSNASKGKQKMEFSYSVDANELNVDNYGKVKLYNYNVRSILPPNR